MYDEIMVKGVLGKKITSKTLLKKEPRATYKIDTAPDYRHSSYFNKEYEKERNIMTWK